MPSRELTVSEAVPRGLGERDLVVDGGRENLDRARPDFDEFGEGALARNREYAQFAGETLFQPKGDGAPT